MTILGSRVLLIAAAVSMLAAAAAFVVSPPEMGDVKTQPDVRLLATRIAHHPTDWAAASALTEVALDARTDKRVMLWHAAYDHAVRLAPERKDPPNAFARAGFFHWAELPERDQSDVLSAYARLLHDPAVFGRMAGPIFELTGDLSYLRRNGPQTADGIGPLIALAVSSGRFADYRALRGELQRKRLDEFPARASTATPEELIDGFPSPPYHSDAEPLIKALLNELHRHPLDAIPNRRDVVEGIADYALRHDLQPLDGLEVISRKPGAASVETQIALAKALGLKESALQLEMTSKDPRRVSPNDHEWQGGCGNDVCTRAWRVIDADHGIALTIQAVQQAGQTDSLPAYVEIYVDDVLRAEGEVKSKQDFIVPVGNRGAHRIEVGLVNPTTRSPYPRRSHVAKIATL